jgi:hypothetical protein
MQCSPGRPQTIQEHSSKNLTIAHLPTFRGDEHFINDSQL